MLRKCGVPNFAQWINDLWRYLENSLPIIAIIAIAIIIIAIKVSVVARAGIMLRKSCVPKFSPIGL